MLTIGSFANMHPGKQRETNVIQNSSTEGNGVDNPLLTVACAVIIIAGAKLAAPILVPILLSLFIAIILLAPIKALTSRGMSHWLSVLMVLIR